MSGHEAEHASATPAASNGGRGAALRAVVTDLRHLPTWCRTHPLRATATACMLVAIAGCVVGIFTYVLPTPSSVQPATLAESLTALDGGDDSTARRLAMEVQSDPKLSYRELGGPLYVLGMAIAHDADKHWNPQEQRLLNLVAAKYLQESQQRGFPEGREAEGCFQLGKSWNLAGEFAKSIAPLQTALQLESKHAPKAKDLLAESYSRLVPPQYTKALRANAAFLADPTISPTERHAGLLREVRIRLALRNFVLCRSALEQVPADTLLAAERAILLGRLLLAEGDALLSSDAAKAAAAKALWQQAGETFRTIPGRGDTEDPPAAAQYLLGVCYERQGDYAAAEAQFARLRRPNNSSPEKIAASMHEVDLLARRKNFDEAVALLLKTLAEEQQAAGSANPWLAEGEIGRRVGQLQQTLLQERAFDAALQLAELPSDMLISGQLTPWQPALWKANAFEARAAATERDAETAPLVKAEALRSSARLDRRRAGQAAAQLAELRSLTRDYTADLLRSAEQYYLGRGYEQAIAATRKYLRNEAERRPDCLLLLGESLLALNQPDQALQELTDCLESFPRHPVTYQARLVAAQASAEKGLLEEAKQLLIENVESEALAPGSNQWRDSLFLLGKLLHREGSQWEAKSRASGIDSEDPDRQRAGLKDLEQANAAYRQAIEQLDKAVARYPKAPQCREGHYLLADSYRQASKWPRKRLKTVSIEATRLALTRQGQLDLEAAVSEYDKLITELGDVQESPNHTPLEKQVLRNGYFAKADSLFDLSRYDDAIKAYSAASNRYQNDPESLEAYVQIAACYRLLNKPSEARGTLQQAQAVLTRLKPDANFARATPYTRDEWEQLLTWLATL